MKIHFRKQKGFSLIELLVSMAVFASVTTVIITVLFVSFRAGKKSDVLISLKQNGDATLAQMVKSIRYAKSLDAPAACTTPVTQASITITSISDAKQTIFSCPAGASTSITSNSASLIDTNAVSVSGCSFTCSQATTNDPPTITIQFTLGAKNTTSFVETTGSIPFQTSVTLRNYNP
ncbi:MAG TPA: type II secretion system protein [Methylomirabilota bacterium]|nr:type II secretion system protein [Methylomirabilota bacterium]